MTETQEKKAAAILIAAAFLLFNLYSLATSLFEASDELWHYPFIQHLVSGGGLPVQQKGQTDENAPWRQEGSQPPLYYAIAALASAPFDHGNWRELRRINPHADMGVPTRDGNANAMLHTPAEQWPWTRAVLAVRVARFVSVILSTLTVLFAYLVSRELFGRQTRDWGLETDTHQSLIPNPQSPFLRLATLIFTAFIPMFAFISGAINNDNAAVLFSTLGLWWALRLMGLRDLSMRSALIAGVITGLGALSKSSAVGLLGLFGVAAFLSISNLQSPISKKALALGSWLLALALTTALIAGWWFVRNLNLYGDLLGWNAFLDSVGRRDPPATLAQLWAEREGFAWAYWGVFGTLNVIMPPWVYGVLNGVVGVAILGWLLAIGNWLRRKVPISQLPIAKLVLCAFWVVLIFVSLLRWTSLTPASQGRLMFPCIAAIAAFVAYGLWRVHRFALLAACVFLMGLAVVVPFAVIAPAYARPGNTWERRLAIPINATFGGSLQLVEAESAIPSNKLEPGNEATLTLNWTLSAPLPSNDSVFVHLVDEQNVILAQRDMYPGQGNMALSELPAGYTWTDHYTLRISPLQLAPKQLRWRVGVYNQKTGARLKLADDAEFVMFDGPALEPRTNQELLLRYANNAQLISYTLQPRAVKLGDVLTVTLNWADAKISSDYSVSVQVLDEDANKIGSHDAPLASTSNDTHAIPINKDAPPGVYRLLLVVYRPSDFARVGAYDGRGQFVGDQIELTRLRVE